MGLPDVSFGGGSIPLSPRYNPPYSPAWVRDIPDKPGDHMTVAVQNRLPGRNTYVESDIVTIRSNIFLDHISALHHQSEHGLSLKTRHREEIRGMAERNNEHMASVDRKAVPDGIAEVVLQNDIPGIGITEWAFLRSIHRSDLRNPDDSPIQTLLVYVLALFMSGDNTRSPANSDGRTIRSSR